MHVKRGLLVVGILSAVLACSVSGGPVEDPRLSEAERSFDLAVAESSPLGLTPVVPARYTTTEFSRQGPEAFLLRLEQVDDRDGMRFLDQIALVCIASTEAKLPAVCDADSAYQSGGGWVRIETLVSGQIQPIRLGEDQGSLERAFEEGWDAWLAP